MELHKHAQSIFQTKYGVPPSNYLGRMGATPEQFLTNVVNIPPTAEAVKEFNTLLENFEMLMLNEVRLEALLPTVDPSNENSLVGKERAIRNSIEEIKGKIRALEDERRLPDAELARRALHVG